MRSLLSKAAVVVLASSQVLATPRRFTALGNPTAPNHGSFVIRLRNEPPSLNPIVSEGYGSVEIQFYVIEALLSQNEQTHEWQPWLADDWRISPSRRYYDFHLRPGVSWSDGVPLTAEDVKFSYDVLFDDRFATAHMRPFYESIESVEILSARWVRFHIKDSYFGNFTSSAGLPIVPQHIYGDPEKGPRLHKTIVGSGPYTLEEFKLGRSITLRKNPHWWGRKDALYRSKHHPERIIFQFVSDDSLAMEMLKKGELDFMMLSPELYARAVKAHAPKDNYVVERIRNLYPQSVDSIGFNLDVALLQDRNIRLAVAYLANRDLVISKILHYAADKATGPWYRQSEFADPSVAPIPYCPDCALKILQKSGWSDSGRGFLHKQINGQWTRLSFTILTARKDAERYLTILQEDAKQIGVDLQIRYVSSSTLWHLMGERRFEAADISWGGGLVEFDPKPAWHSKSIGLGANSVGYRNPRVDKLIDQARRIYDFRQRISVMREIYRQIAYDLPHVFLFNGNSVFYARSCRAQLPTPTYRYDLGIKYWWIK